MSITERELLMLQDQLSIHATMAEKAGYYASQTTDPEIRGVLSQLQRGHQRHVDSIVQHITQSTGAGMLVAGAGAAAGASTGGQMAGASAGAQMAGASPMASTAQSTQSQYRGGQEYQT